eukprot:783034-Rhodomonas_salina.1
MHLCNERSLDSGVRYWNSIAQYCDRDAPYWACIVRRSSSPLTAASPCAAACYPPSPAHYRTFRSECLAA